MFSPSASAELTRAERVRWRRDFVVRGGLKSLATTLCSDALCGALAAEAAARAADGDRRRQPAVLPAVAAALLRLVTSFYCAAAAAAAALAED